MAATDAKPFPQKNVAYRVTFPILDADGDLVTGAASLDSEISKDGGTFADCTNEATEIATSSGVYFLDLTSTEMNADTVAIIVKTGTAGAKTTVLVMYPQESDDIRVSVTHYGGTAGTFASGRPEVNTSHIAGSAVSTSSAQIGVNVVNAAGTAWNSGAIGASTLAADTIAASKIAADAITAAKIADGAIDAATFAAGAINAAAIATDAITAAKIAADAIGDSEVASDVIDAIWAKAMTELSSVPGVTASVLDAVRWLFLLSRNKITQTATTQTLRNDADSGTVATSTVSDDGTTFTRGEFA